jgi:localization factor PodJL
LLREAAERGDAEAQFELALAFEKGQQVDQDISWAARWYGKAAYQGHPDSQYHYGRMKMRGLGVSRDLGHAYRWLALAAQQGHRDAKKLSEDLEFELNIDLLYLQRDWVKLFQPSTGAWPSDPATVEFLQRKLGRLGYDPGPTDGVMGPRTSAALEGYKADRGLPPSAALSEDLLEKIRAIDREEITGAEAWQNPDEPSDSQTSAAEESRTGLY